MNAFTILLTGYSGAGKTTIAMELQKEFLRRSMPVELLDGDVIRKNLSFDLDFSRESRFSNAKRTGFLSGLLSRNGINVIVSMIAPYSECRDAIRHQVKNYKEVYVKCPIDICEKRDVKGLYQKVRDGRIEHFTGISDPYEVPICPDVVCKTNKETVVVSVAKILKNLGMQTMIRKEIAYPSLFYTDPEAS
ncbi:MAG: adenylyl-sulfate kinase [Chitinophagaceae bacterium]|jgi:adenylylsulfate kinase|nr:MAG: adenylyl-sulfate kinase [Chitinophagaceae bacterium]